MKDKRYIIADNVRLYRRKEELTQMELAELADLSLASIKRIENGSRTMSLENFLRISDALHVPLSLLVCENDLVMSEVEKVKIIFEGRDERQRKYLLHMLWEMANELDKLV